MAEYNAKTIEQNENKMENQTPSGIDISLQKDVNTLLNQVKDKYVRGSDHQAIIAALGMILNKLDKNKIHNTLLYLLKILENTKENKGNNKNLWN